MINFTPVNRTGHRVGVPGEGTYTLIFDETRGLLGRGVKKARIKAEAEAWDGRAESILIDLPAYGVRIFEF